LRREFTSDRHEPGIFGFRAETGWCGGVAIIVDLDKIEGRGPAGRILMPRS
jgi:hypothetical protein